jgi:hypothetical protein
MMETQERKRTEKHMRRGQASTEFTLLIGFLMLTFLIMFVLFSERIKDISKDNLDKTMNNFENIIGDEVKTAYTVEDGYRKEFTLLKNILGETYNLSILDSTILVVNYTGNQHTMFLPGYVKGGFCLNPTTDTDPYYYHVIITKNAGIVSVSSCPDCAYSYAMCDNADRNPGMCDWMESFFPGFKTECCNGNCKCC